MQRKKINDFYKLLDIKFERVSEISTRVFGHSLLFILVLAVVMGWFIVTLPQEETFSEILKDFFIGFSFLTFFLIQRTLNKYNKALHVKLNELVRSHDAADNSLINVEEKTHEEIEQIAKDLHEDIVNNGETTQTESKG